MIYHIEAIPNRADVVQIRADKLVAGKTVTMGAGPWKYDAEKQTLTWETEARVWKLAIKGMTIEGTLTLSPENVVFRRMTLKKLD